MISLILAGGALAALGAEEGAEEAGLTPSTFKAELDKKPAGAEAQGLAERVRAWFGRDALAKGANPKVEGLMVAWAIEAPDAKVAPQIVSADGSYALRLTRFGATDLYANVDTLQNGAGMRWAYMVDGQKKGQGQLEVYTAPPEMKAQPDAPKGTLTLQPKWVSKIYEGAERDWWVYVPAQYKPENPACVMVFQDGQWYKDYVPTVFDNLIAKGEMPVTVGIFLTPGSYPDNRPLPRGQRSMEYDTLSDKYARFLLEEILPEVEKTLKLRHDPESRAVAGMSSGGICAFTVAWERPDQFGKVLSWIGSFTGIASGPTLKEGGNNYPVMIRKTEKKPIRVFLQDGANDLDNEHGDWPLANQEMAKALAYKGYDYSFVFGNGFHSPEHGRAILPDSLRWLWRDYKP
jgi:enterochelin esterase family protein